MIPLLTPKEHYHMLETLWKIELERELPVWDVLRDLHRRLCEMEDTLRQQRPAECLRNLYGRVHGAAMLGLELERPEWAAPEYLGKWAA
jgi:hypothetical protein